MVKCSRCKHTFDETTRSTCPLCFTPVSDDTERVAVAPENSAAPVASAGLSPTATPPVASAPESPAGPSVSSAPLLNGMPLNTPLPSNPIQQPSLATMTPLSMSQTAAPASAPVAAGANMRVSPLTGEMISGPATEAQPSLSAGMSAPKPNASNALPPLRSAGAGDRTSGIVRDHGPAPELAIARNNRIKELIVVAIILMVAGVAGYTYYTHLPKPQDIALAYYKSVIKEDWKTVYDQTLFSDDDKTKFPDSDTFAKQAATSVSNPIAQVVMAQLKQSVDTIKVGEPKIDGDKADVPTSAKITFKGITIALSGTAHMINKDGWKFNGSAGGVTQAMQDMLGKPAMGSAGN